MEKSMNTYNCMNMQFELLDGMFFDNREETSYYILCTSKVMDDYFWEYCIFKNKS